MEFSDLIITVSNTIAAWFNPNSLPTTLSVFGTFMTLYVAVQTKRIAIKAYNQIEREDPWKITPLKDDLWLLERVHPSIATIYGQIILPNGMAHNPKQYLAVLGKKPMGIEFYNPPKKPLEYFLRGSKILIKMPSSVPVGSSFNLCYIEHKTIKQAKSEPYKGLVNQETIEYLKHSKEHRLYRILRVVRRTKDIKVWETPVYSIDKYL